MPFSLFKKCESANILLPKYLSNYFWATIEPLDMDYVVFINLRSDLITQTGEFLPIT